MTSLKPLANGLPCKRQGLSRSLQKRPAEASLLAGIYNTWGPECKANQVKFKLGTFTEVYVQLSTLLVKSPANQSTRSQVHPTKRVTEPTEITIIDSMPRDQRDPYCKFCAATNETHLLQRS